MQRTSRGRDAFSAFRNDPHRGAGTNITTVDSQLHNHADAFHCPVTTGNDPVPDGPRHPTRGLTPLRARPALHSCTGGVTRDVAAA
jgi:hypothetical protein